jgi:type VI secretion system protein ImpE
MNATELFKANKLQDAITAQTQEVKTNPGDQAKRLFLFELLAFAGDLDRARRQIDSLVYDDAELTAAAAAYRKQLDSELARRAFFRDGAPPPQFLADPPPHLQLRVQAAQRLREGQPAEAAELLAQAQAQTPEIHGVLSGKPFDGLRDCDDLFSGVLEVMAQGKYFWLPFEQIDTLACKAPESPRDLLWLPGHLSVKDGPDGDVFLPALYPGSHEHADDAVKLGRKTDWCHAAGAPVLGVGQKVFLRGDDDLPLLEWRELEVLTVGAPA